MVPHVQAFLQEMTLLGAPPGLGSPVAQMVKYLPAVPETWVQSLGREDPLEEEMAIHSSIPTRKVSWTEKPCGSQSKGLQRAFEYAQ